LVDTPAAKVVICIQTDGQENSSTGHSWSELNALVKEKAALGWQFNFMGVGMDAYDQGARMGIAPAATVAYDHHNQHATKEAFRASAENARDYSRGARPCTVYSEKQKQRAGDRFGGFFSRKPTSDTASKRELKKGIVDDITL
jgi:hypothetical protein